jgi:hypothetical protein
MRKLLFAFVALMLATMATAQVKLTKGSVAPLKGEKSDNLEFTYEDMKVGKDDEAKYVERKKSEYNKKEAGKGDQWEKDWVEDRTTRYHPKFRELFKEYSGMSTVVPESKYTLILATTVTEPGYNIGISRKNAYIDCTATFVETGDRSKVIAVITLKNMPGRAAGGYDFDTGQRIEEAYAKAGKELAQYMAKLNK